MGRFERGDLVGRAARTHDVREVADDRNGVSALRLDLLFDLVEFGAIAADQHHGAMLGELKRGATADSGRRPGDNPSLPVRGGWGELCHVGSFAAVRVISR